jgi:hypothetical protein
MVVKATKNVVTAEFLGATPDNRVACVNCMAWRPNPAQANQVFGGCAKSGQTTTHFGDTRYVHYTPDLSSCSYFERKQR